MQVQWINRVPVKIAQSRRITKAFGKWVAIDFQFRYLYQSKMIIYLRLKTHTTHIHYKHE